MKRAILVLCVLVGLADPVSAQIGQSGIIPGASSSTTSTATFVAPRVTTITSSATPTPNADTTDLYVVSALAVGTTFGEPTGTPSNGQRLTVKVKDDGTSRSLAFNAVYRAGSDLALPTATTLGKSMYLGFVWNSTESKWDFVAKTDGY